MQKGKHSENVYNEYPLSSAQSEYLDKIWSFNCRPAGGKELSYYILPDYTSTLLYIRSIEDDSENFLAVLGPASKKGTLKTTGEVFLAGFRFLPGLLPNALGLSSAQIKNKLIYFNEIKVAGRFEPLINRLIGAKTEKSILKIMNQLCLELSRLIEYPDTDIAASVSLMIGSGGRIRESALVEKLTIGIRQFQRKFLERLGISPKEFCRLIRLHNSTRELATGNSDQFEVLVNAGYYDQSHYYREFKKLIGILPTAFVTRQKKISYGRLEK